MSGRRGWRFACHGVETWAFRGKRIDRTYNCRYKTATETVVKGHATSIATADQMSDQLACRLHFQFFHQPAAMGLDGPGANGKIPCNDFA